MIRNLKTGFIGCGNMGSALAAAASGAPGCELLLCDTNAEAAEKLAASTGGKTADISRIAAECACVFLAVKPNCVDGVCDELAKLGCRALMVSMAAGVPLERLAEHLGKDARIIRIMPNTPVSVGAGVLLYTRNSNATEADAGVFAAMMTKAGKLYEVPENMIDSAGTVTGCGPAFVAMFAEAMADGAVVCGVPRKDAYEYVLRTIAGTAELMLETGKHPGQVKDEVCSPGGTTIAGVETLESAAFRAAVAGAVTSSYRRTIGK